MLPPMPILSHHSNNQIISSTAPSSPMPVVAKSLLHSQPMLRPKKTPSLRRSPPDCLSYRRFLGGRSPGRGPLSGTRHLILLWALALSPFFLLWGGR